MVDKRSYEVLTYILGKKWREKGFNTKVYHGSAPQVELKGWLKEQLCLSPPQPQPSLLLFPLHVCDKRTHADREACAETPRSPPPSSGELGLLATSTDLFKVPQPSRQTERHTKQQKT